MERLSKYRDYNSDMTIAPHITLPSVRLLNETSDVSSLAITQNLMGEKITDFRAASSLDTLFKELDTKASANPLEAIASKFSIGSNSGNMASLPKLGAKPKQRKLRPNIQIFDVDKNKDTGEPLLNIKKSVVRFLQKIIKMLES